MDQKKGSWSAFSSYFSVISYAGSIFFVDRLLKLQPLLANALVFLTLLCVLLLCVNGHRCFHTGFKSNLVLATFAALTLASNLLTLHGQALAGVLARLVFKGLRVASTVTLRSLSDRKLPTTDTLGSTLCALGGMLFFLFPRSLVINEHSGGSYQVGIFYLLVASFLDSTVNVFGYSLIAQPGARFHMSATTMSFSTAFYGLTFLSLGAAFKYSQSNHELLLPIVGSLFKTSWADFLGFSVCSGVTYALTFPIIAAWGPVYFESFKLTRKLIAIIIFAMLGNTQLPLGSFLSLLVCGIGLWMVSTPSSELDVMPERGLREQLPNVGWVWLGAGLMLAFFVSSSASNIFVSSLYVPQDVAGVGSLRTNGLLCYPHCTAAVEEQYIAEKLVVQHTTFMLSVRRAEDNHPFMAIKLTCRIRSNIPDRFEVRDSGPADGRVVGSTAEHSWGEILTAAIMELSKSAQVGMLSGRGLVIQNPGALFGESIYKIVPPSCFWEDKILKGWSSTFVNNLTRIPAFRHDKNFSEFSKKDAIALAILWIMDAASTNFDRQRNLFVDGTGHIIPLDLHSLGNKISKGVCSEAEINKVLEEIRFHVNNGPNFIENFDPLKFNIPSFSDWLCNKSPGLVSILDHALEILDELCTEDDCRSLQSNLELILRSNPWFQHESAVVENPPSTLVEPMCCGDEAKLPGGRIRNCTRCSLLSPYGWQHAVDIRIPEVCFKLADFPKTLTGYIATATAFRFSLIKTELKALAQKCGEQGNRS